MTDIAYGADYTSRVWWQDVGERALRTALQTLIPFLALGLTVFGQNVVEALLAVGFATLLSFVGSVLTARGATTGNFVIDVLERAVKTFLYSAVALIPSNSVTFTDVDWNSVLVQAATATVLSLITAYLAKNKGVPGTASALSTQESLEVVYEYDPATYGEADGPLPYEDNATDSGYGSLGGAPRG